LSIIHHEIIRFRKFGFIKVIDIIFIIIANIYIYRVFSITVCMIVQTLPIVLKKRLKDEYSSVLYIG